MEEIKDKGIHHTALKIRDDLQRMISYTSFFTEVQKLVSSPNVSRGDNFKESLLKAMKENGLEVELRNNIFHWVRSQKKEMEPPIPIETFFKKAQVQWEKRINKSLNSMCSELGINLARIRGTAERDEILEKWGQLSNYDVDIQKYRPVYAPKDFFEVLINLKGPNNKQKIGYPRWEMSHIPLKVKTLFELRALYSELSHGEPLMGMGVSSYMASKYASFEAERISLGEKILKYNHAPVAQEYLKKGCAPCLRAKVWTLVLGSEVTNEHVMHFEILKEHVLKYDLMSDKLIIKDIHLIASNDDQYFVFEDVLHQIMLCFSRDSDILLGLHRKPGYMQVVLKGKQPSPENTVIFPPSGVIPFHGFTMYAAPFCYLFDNSISLYFTVRAFYLRYWFRLHRVCEHPQGIVSLCLLYERLLQCYDPIVYHHLKTNNIPPVRVVFKWLMRAFSGHLPPEQLLYLWDLVLAYDSLEITSLLAVSILIFRRENILRVNAIADIDAVLADLSSIGVMSMLQMALSKE